MAKPFLPPRVFMITALALSGSSTLAIYAGTEEVSRNGPGRTDDGVATKLSGFAVPNHPDSSAAVGAAAQLFEDFGGGGRKLAETLHSPTSTASLYETNVDDSAAGVGKNGGGQNQASALRSSVETTDSCASYLTCQECSASSKVCHWCHDQSCHAALSRFGCARAESCDQPTTPEPTPPPPPEPTIPLPPQPTQPPPPPKNETGCSSYDTCKECSSSAWNCHWCGDNRCHTVGSMHGCLRAESCDPPAPPPPKVNNTSCSSHKTCSECALASKFCHFCAHDNQCHSKGSIHGCLSGVNCYSNDRCTRKEPEAIKRNVFGQIGVLQALAIVAGGMALLCCATACVSTVGCVARAYDDLSAIAAEVGRDGGRGEYEPPEMDSGIDADASEQVALMPPSSDGSDEECDGEGENEVEDAEEDVEVANEEEETGLLPVEVCDDNDDEEEADAQTPFLLWRSGGRRPRRRSRPMSDVMRFYSRCKICYAVAVATVMAAVATSLICFPKAPDYNVCNNQVAWKSIVDGVTSGEIEASFQLLMSVENPNHMSVVVDMGSGTFKHDEVEVGTFEIPTSTVSAMSITDVLVAVTFTPDKWQALALSTEYYKGTLKFAVDATATVVIPSLAGYTFSGGIENYIVHANDPKLQDRRLCACPQWKDEKKKDGPGLKFTDMMGFAAN